MEFFQTSFTGNFGKVRLVVTLPKIKNFLGPGCYSDDLEKNEGGRKIWKEE